MPEPMKEGKSYALTRQYARGALGKPLKKGTSLLVTRIYKGWTGVYVDVRLDDGSFVRKIPFSYFRS